MTQDEMIELAKQVGWQYAHGESGFEPLWDFAKLVTAKEQDRCCSIVFSHCESDNVAQRTVDAIRGKA